MSSLCLTEKFSKKWKCKHCNQVFNSHQALGGHSKRHSAGRKNHHIASSPPPPPNNPNGNLANSIAPTAHFSNASSLIPLTSFAASENNNNSFAVSKNSNGYLANSIPPTAHISSASTSTTLPSFAASENNNSFAVSNNSNGNLDNPIVPTANISNASTSTTLPSFAASENNNSFAVSNNANGNLPNSIVPTAHISNASTSTILPSFAPSENNDNQFAVSRDINPIFSESSPNTTPFVVPQNPPFSFTYPSSSTFYLNDPSVVNCSNPYVVFEVCRFCGMEQTPGAGLLPQHLLHAGYQEEEQRELRELGLFKDPVTAENSNEEEEEDKSAGLDLSLHL